MSAQSFVDPFNQEYQPSSIPQDYTAIDSMWGKFGQGLGMVDRNEYLKWLTEEDRKYERASVNSARAWDEYMDSTHYQRMVKDLQAAGLNPWLALQNGIGGTSSTQTASTGSSAKNIVNKESSGKTSLALILISAARLIAAL